MFLGRLVLIAIFGFAFWFFLFLEPHVFGASKELLLGFFLVTPVLVILTGVMSVRYRRTGISFFLVLLGSLYAGYLMPGGVQWDVDLLGRIRDGVLLLLPFLFIFFSLSPDRGFVSFSGLGGIGSMILSAFILGYLSLGPGAPERIELLRSLGPPSVTLAQVGFMASWNLNFIQTLLIATGFLVLLLAAAFRRRRSGWLAPWPFILLSFTAGVSRLSDVPVLLYWLLVGVGFVFVILLHEALIERFFDPETGVKNMRALGLRKRYGFSQTIVRTAFLEDFEGYLQKYGPGVGSQYLRMTASFLGSLGPRADVYRLEGPAFALVYPRSFTKFFDTKKIEEDFRRRGFRLRKTRQKISVSLVIVEEGLAKSGQIVPDELYLEQEHTDT